MNIRPMTLEDIPKLDDLMNYLGYPSSNLKIQERFNKILNLPDYKTFVAEINDKLVGFVGMCKQTAYEFDEPYVRVLALVVHEDFRRKNIGQSLMLAVEDWAKKNHCITITLNSGNREERIAAHNFYKNLGYLGKSTGFSKNLTEFNQ
ncbi:MULTISPECIES: GNAT family N-acetyltransferase [Paenibacillus]|uniref:GNAT family N-acetyltransferase n=1 Tax=Paenibacillus TaxID=44249 RepID=UPI0003862A1C|nr:MULTISPECIES: GNAT family N-acetyltransferase [Paenibacillus]EPY12903.1 GCN5-related N-acetyltransferase [Paenibacillus alvei A6-6i-x]SDE52573.1 Predicted N-acetyltransferase YhbS [Paenibacillus sp. cl6col]